MGKKQDVQKARFWRKAIQEAARSGLSTREFCRQRRLHESQFYWWQRRLAARPCSQGRKPAGEAATFARVGEEPAANDAGIELVLAGARRLRIARGLLGRRARRHTRLAQYKARMPACPADSASGAWGWGMQRARQPHRRVATRSE